MDDGAVFIADYAYIAQSESELSVVSGDKILILSKEGEWVYGQHQVTGQTGWIASSFGHIRLESPYQRLDERTKSQQRTATLQNLTDSESAFVKSLNDLQETLIAPLSIRDTSFKRSFMSEPSVAVSFTLLTDMLKACGKFCSLLIAAKDERAVAAAYMQFAPSMQLFAQFASENIQLLNATKNNFKQLTKFIPKTFPLIELLVEPMDHYPQYRQLLQEYVWLSSTGNSAELESALGLVIAQSEYIDLKLKEESEALKLLALQDQFSGHPVIFTSARRLLWEGEVERVKAKLVNNNNNNGNVELDVKTFAAHLFNDALAYSTYTISGKFRLQVMLDLRSVRLERATVGGSTCGFVLYANDNDLSGEHFRIPSGGQDYEEFMALVLAQLESIRSKRLEVRTANIATTALTLSLPGVNISSLGPQSALVYRFLLSELQFSETVSTLNMVLVQPLLDAAKGAVLKANDGSSAALASTNENATSRYQAALVTEALKEGDVLIALRAVEGLAITCKEFVKAVESSASANRWTDSDNLIISIADIFKSVSAQTLFNQFKAFTGGEPALLRVLRTAPFVAFVKDCESILAGISGTLEEKLDLPRIRIKIFKSFLMELQIVSAGTSQGGLVEALAGVESMDREIAELLRLKRNFEALLEIQNSLITVRTEPIITSLASMDRTFLKQGDLKKVCRKKDKLFRFWLTSDLLLYGAAVGGEKFTFNRALELHKVSAASHTTSDVRNAIEVLGAEKSFVVIAPTQQVCDEWLVAIKSASERAREALGLSANLEVAPLWTPDSNSLNCTACNKPFTLFKRRHHCRKCGALVCNDHLSTNVILPHISTTVKQKICDNCVAGITGTDSGPSSAHTSVASSASVAGATAAAAAAGSHVSTGKNQQKRSSLWGALSLSGSNNNVTSEPSSDATRVPEAEIANPLKARSATTSTAHQPAPAAQPAARRTSLFGSSRAGIASKLAAKHDAEIKPPPLPGVPPPPLPPVHHAEDDHGPPPPIPATPPPPVPSFAPPPVPDDNAHAIAVTSVAPVSAPAAARAPPSKPRRAPPPPPGAGAVVVEEIPAPVIPPSVVFASAPQHAPAAVVPPPAPVMKAHMSPSVPPPPMPVNRPPAPSGGIPPPPPPPPGRPPAPKMPPSPQPQAASNTQPQSQPPPQQQQQVSETDEDDPFRRFIKMREMVSKGMLPEGALRQKLRTDGYAENDIDRFISGSVDHLTLSAGSGDSSGMAAALSSASLKPAELSSSASPAPPAGKMSLLEAIQKGSKLKAVQADDTRVGKSPPAANAATAGGMLSMLAAKMSERRFNMGVASRPGAEEDSDSDGGFSDSDGSDDD